MGMVMEGLGWGTGRGRDFPLRLPDRLWDPSSLLGDGYRRGTGGKVARA